MNNYNYNALYASTGDVKRSTTSQTPEAIPSLKLPLPPSPLPDQNVAVLTCLSVPSFWIVGCTPTQDQGIIFSLYYDGKEFARGGYSFPNTAQGPGRISMTLNGVTFLRSNGASIEARWQVYGNGLTANIDTPALLIVHLGIVGPSA